MNADQFSKTDFQNHDKGRDSEYRAQKPDRRWLLYGIGLLAFVIILVICMFLIITCKIPIFNKTLPFCRANPPTITKRFLPNPIGLNGVSTLTFTLGNSNSVALTGVTFTDALPAGLQVADTPSATTTCSGEPTWAPLVGTKTLVFGSPAGGTIPANGSCSISVNIKGITAGSYQNVSGYVSSSNGGVNTGDTGRATASLMVNPPTNVSVKPPNIAQVFEPDQISSNSTSTLTFTISNLNTSQTLDGVAFSNTYPPGLTNTTPLSTTHTCGDEPKATAGGNSVSFSGGTLPPSSTCTITIDVTASNMGPHTNTSGAVSSTNGGTGNAASDTLYIDVPPLSIIFLKEISTSEAGPWSDVISVSEGASVFYQFTIENRGDVSFSPISVTDPVVSTVGCSWPAILPVAVSGNENHIAKCVVGPITVESGIHTNTATASGIYNGTTYTSNPSSATYEFQPQTGINLYLPELREDQQGFKSQIQEQLDKFAATERVTIAVNYYSDIQSLKNGNAIGLIGLRSEDVRDFAQQELLLPVTALPSDQIFLADAIEGNKINGRLFAYPWRREFCTPNYVNLAISARLPTDLVGKANLLAGTLTNEDNQRSNFEAWQIYPTLDVFYRTTVESKFPEVSCRDADAKAVSQAPNLFAPFVDKFGIKINFDLTKGLDSAQISDVTDQLVGIIVPVRYDNTVGYKGREIKGVFYVDNNLLTFETIVLVGKGTPEYPLLPEGTYMLACNTPLESKNCLAVSQTGEEFQFNPDVIEIKSDRQVQANIPYARYEQGSHKICFGICIRGYHKKKK